MKVCVECKKELYPERGLLVRQNSSGSYMNQEWEKVLHCVNQNCNRYGLLTIVWKEE